jgi:pyruvate dehydrogenase E1 component beta subunit
VVVPSTPYDAKGLLITAIRDPDPVLFLEHKSLYGTTSPGGGKVSADRSFTQLGGDVPEEAYSLPFGCADIKRAGTDATIVATMSMVHRALAVAERFAGEGIELEVVDPRTLVPLDQKTILGSVRKTHRAVVVSEEVARAGAPAEIATLISHNAFDDLDAPVERVGAAATPIPFAPVAEARAVPQVSDIADAVRRVLEN